MTGTRRSNPAASPASQDAVGRRTLPGNPASAVYGTVLVAGQLAVESDTERSPALMLLGLVGTVVVFWIAHAYTDSLGAAISADHSGLHSLRHTLRAEWPIVESGALPAIILLVAAAAGAHPSTGALLALVVAVVQLIGWALLAARRAGLSGARRLTYTAAAGLLGLVIVGLKYALH